MLNAMSTVVPILIILCLGYFCRKKSILREEEINGIKKVSIRFLWPLVLFYAFFTANFGAETILFASIVFITNLAMFIMAMFLRKRVRIHAFSYPYLLSGFEIGMIGYAFYTLLFGPENISYLALLDVGHALFIFPVFLGYLNMEQGQGDLKKSIKDMLISPIMISLLIGMVFGLSGLGRTIMNSQIGTILDKMYELASSTNVVMILLVMGYNIFSPESGERKCKNNFDKSHNDYLLCSV